MLDDTRRPDPHHVADAEVDAIELGERYHFCDDSELAAILPWVTERFYGRTGYPDEPEVLYRAYAPEVAGAVIALQDAAERLVRWDSDAYGGIVDMGLLDACGPVLSARVIDVIRDLAHVNRTSLINPRDELSRRGSVRMLLRYLFKEHPKATAQTAVAFVTDALKDRWPSEPWQVAATVHAVLIEFGVAADVPDLAS